MTEADTKETTAHDPGEGGAPAALDHRKRRRGRRLHTLRHLRTLIAAQVRKLEAVPDDQLKFADRVQRARTIVYAASTMGELMRAQDLEARLIQLEDLVRTRGTH